MRQCGIRDASKQNLAEELRITRQILAKGFSRNLVGRNTGLYHRMFQEPIYSLIHLPLQGNGVKQRGPAAKLLLAFIANVGRLKEPLIRGLGLLLVDFPVPA
jgi:hypothetical protein